LQELPADAAKGSPQLAKYLTADQPMTRYYAALIAWRAEKNPASVEALAALLKVYEPLPGEVYLPGQAHSAPLIAARAAEQLGVMGTGAKRALPALRAAEARGFVMWYFFESRLQRVDGAVYIPSDYHDYHRMMRVIVTGQAAAAAIQQIESGE
jgi:hypothetical protein